MTLELIQVIALLCNMNVSQGSNWNTYSEKHQHNCQKYYVECTQNSTYINKTDALIICISKKKVR